MDKIASSPCGVRTRLFVQDSYFHPLFVAEKRNVDRTWYVVLLEFEWCAYIHQEVAIEKRFVEIYRLHEIFSVGHGL
jgi:hypothetical protein